MPRTNAKNAPPVPTIDIALTPVEAKYLQGWLSNVNTLRTAFTIEGADAINGIRRKLMNAIQRVPS